MSKTIAMWIAVVALVVNAVATTVIAVNTCRYKDPNEVIIRWEEMKKTAQKEQSGLKPGEPVEGFSPINSSGNKETREPGSWFHTESHTGT